jgi:hypothetical protein
MVAFQKATEVGMQDFVKNQDAIAALPLSVVDLFFVYTDLKPPIK